MNARTILLGLVFGSVALLQTMNAAAVTIVPLGNLFDDPKLTNLATAIGTDTGGADADVSDLGVQVAYQGSLASPFVIAPGITFDFSGAGGGAEGAFGGIRNDRAYNTTAIIRTTGVYMGVPTPVGNGEEPGIGMHANSVLTFNLAEIRAAGGLGSDAFTFTGEGGLNDDTSSLLRVGALVSDSTGVLAGYINGVQVAVTNAGSWSFTGALPADFVGTFNPGDFRTAPFNINVPSSAEYLTLFSLTVDGNGSDQAVFAFADLTSIDPPPVPEPASLALLLSGLALVVRRRRR